MTELSIRPFTEQDIHLWNDFVKDNKKIFTIADNPATAKVIENIYHWKAYRFLIFDDTQLVGLFTGNLLGKKIVSIPHFSYGGIVIKENYTQNKEIIFKKILAELGVEEYEIRDFEPIGAHYNTNKITSFLHLHNNPEDQLASFKSKLRSQIKKSHKNGLTTEIGTIDKLDEFYKVYCINMHQLGSPVYPKKFFATILQRYEYGKAMVFITYYNDKPIGAGFVISYLGFAEVCWASTIRAYNKLSTNMNLYWGIISTCIINENTIFSFGRSTKDAPTLKFKKQWGVDEVQLFFNTDSPFRGSIKELTYLSTVWSKLPRMFVNAVGPFFSKRIY